MFYRAIAVLLLTALPLASSALERIELLSPELQTYVRISNTVEFWSMIKQSSFGKLWQDRQFQDFLGNPDREMWEEMLFEGESEAEARVFAEQMKMLRGEVIVAFDPDLEQPHLIAAMTREDFLRSLEMDAQLSETMEEPFEIIRQTFQALIQPCTKSVGTGFGTHECIFQRRSRISQIGIITRKFKMSFTYGSYLVIIQISIISGFYNLPVSQG